MYDYYRHNVNLKFNLGLGSSVVVTFCLLFALLEVRYRVGCMLILLFWFTGGELIARSAPKNSNNP